MTQPVEAVGGEATPVESTDPAEVFTKLAGEHFGVTDEDQEPEAEGEEPESATEDETEVEEEADDLPPIDAPVSWDAEAKAKFAELPRDVQELVSKREGERERFVQSKSQEAARAKQDALQAATAQLAQIERQYAQHAQQLAEQLQPQRPNPALLQHDPAAFYAQQAHYEETVAQQRELQQRSAEYAQQAQAREAQAAQAQAAEEHRTIVENFPEYLDPTTGPKLRAELSAVAKELGYPDELIGQARASDIMAMKKVSDLKVKADKYDALMSQKMAGVRAAKGLPKVAKPGVAQGSDQVRSRNAQSALETARITKDRNVQGAAFFDYLTKTGQI